MFRSRKVEASPEANSNTKMTKMTRRRRGKEKNGKIRSPNKLDQKIEVKFTVSEIEIEKQIVKMLRSDHYDRSNNLNAFHSS